MIKKLLAALIIIATSAAAQSQSLQLQTDTTVAFPDNVVGAFSPSIIRNFMTNIYPGDLGLPGVTSSIGSTGVAGLQLPCSGITDCGWSILQQPSSQAQAIIPALFIQRSSSYMGGVTNSATPNILALTYTSPTGTYFEWAMASQLYNETHAAQAAQNVAVNGTALVTNATGVTGAQATTVTISHATPAVVKWSGSNFADGDQVQFSTTGGLPASLAVGTTYYVIAAGLTADQFEIAATLDGAAINTTSDGTGVQSAVYQVGSTWASYFNCADLTGIINPTANCVGSMIGVSGITGTDTNLQRIGAQISVSGSTSASTNHVGIGLEIKASDLSTIDHAIYVDGSGGYTVGLDLSQATFTAAPIVLPVYTIAQLNALTGMAKGSVAYVYDTTATTPVWHAQVAGSSNVTVGATVSFNGTIWIWD